MSDVEGALRDRTVLVTGGSGSVGSALVDQVLARGPAAVRVLTNDENSLHEWSEGRDDPRLRLLLGDIRNPERVRLAMKGVDVVFHAAALKHVPFCERNPFEAVEVNVLGTQNLVRAALDEDVDAFVGISTDKAVNPCNTLGATKLLSEKLILDANYYKGDAPTRFWCARFGNVLNSRGSVVPVIRHQLASGGPVTITHPEMTRFVLPIERAARVVVSSLAYCHGGEVVVPAEMDVVRVGDLVHAIADEFTQRTGTAPASIDETGMRPGEKMHESLFSEEEAPFVRRVADAYVLCALARRQGHAPGCAAYEMGDQATGVPLSSREVAPLSRSEIITLLRGL